MRLLVTAMLCFSVGAHWFVLQSIAWTTMVVQYSQHVSLTQAVAQTFDGEHPCRLCKAITATKHSEKKNGAMQPVAKKADLICVSPPLTQLLPYSEIPFGRQVTHLPLRFDSPPTPPPRPELA